MQRYYLYQMVFPNEKKYVGLSKDVSRRIREHKRLAAKGSALPVHAAIRKFQTYTFQVLCCGDRDHIAALEISYIAALHLQDRDVGYNIAIGGDIGLMHVPSIRAKMAKSQKLRYLKDPSIGKTIGDRLRGRKLPKEVVEKVRSTLIGRKRTSESREKTRLALLGHRHTVQSRKKMSEAPRPIMLCITNGVKNSRIRQGVSLPEGWWYGMLNSNSLGRRWITNGLTNCFIKSDISLSEGWRYGRTK